MQHQPHYQQDESIEKHDLQQYQQPYPHQQQPHQHQLLQPTNATQPGLSWIYTDLPVKKLNVLGIIQMIIGAIYIILSYHSSSNISTLGYSWSVAILGSGAAAWWTLKRKDKMLVTGTGLLALMTAVFTAFIVVLTILSFVAFFDFYNSISESNSSSRLGYGSGSGSSYGSDSNSYNHGMSQGTLDMVYSVALGVYITSIIFLVFELIVSIMLALTCRKIIQTLLPVPPNSGAPVAMVTYVQQA